MTRHLKIFLLASSLALGVFACVISQPGTENTSPTPEPTPIVLQGKGSQTLGPFPVIEGELQLKVNYTSSVVDAYFGVGILQDNNLDGKFCGDEDYTCIVDAPAPAFQEDSPYGEILQIDAGAGKQEIYGGTILVMMDTMADDFGAWEITIENQPEPKHTINGHVEAPLIKDGQVYPEIITTIEGASVEAKDLQGITYTAITDINGDFEITVYGFTDYTLTVTAPGYAPASQSVSNQDFLALEYPTWGVRSEFTLEPDQ